MKDHLIDESNQVRTIKIANMSENHRFDCTKSSSLSDIILRNVSSGDKVATPEAQNEKV